MINGKKWEFKSLQPEATGQQQKVPKSSSGFATAAYAAAVLAIITISIVVFVLVTSPTESASALSRQDVVTGVPMQLVKASDGRRLSDDDVIYVYDNPRINNSVDVGLKINLEHLRFIFDICNAVQRQVPANGIGQSRLEVLSHEGDTTSSRWNPMINMLADYHSVKDSALDGSFNVTLTRLYGTKWINEPPSTLHVNSFGTKKTSAGSVQYAEGSTFDLQIFVPSYRIETSWTYTLNETHWGVNGNYRSFEPPKGTQQIYYSSFSFTVTAPHGEEATVTVNDTAIPLIYGDVDDRHVFYLRTNSGREWREDYATTVLLPVTYSNSTCTVKHAAMPDEFFVVFLLRRQMSEAGHDIGKLFTTTKGPQDNSDCSIKIAEELKSNFSTFSAWGEAVVVTQNTTSFTDDCNNDIDEAGNPASSSTSTFKKEVTGMSITVNGVDLARDTQLADATLRWHGIGQVVADNSLNELSCGFALFESNFTTTFNDENVQCTKGLRIREIHRRLKGPCY